MKWYIKEFSQLTNISVRMLRHYDKINLLTPSIRLPNNYRLYSEADLVKLQQIMALKFFGFNLKQIQSLNTNVLENFLMQKKVLEEKYIQLQHALKTLDVVITEFKTHQTVDWNNTIKLMEDYQMISEWKKALEKILTPEEMQKASQLLSSGFDEQHDQEWAKLSKEVSKHLKEDPLSETGKMLAKKWMDLVSEVFTNEYRMLGKAIWEKGYKTGKLHNEHYSKDVIDWIDKAIHNYYEQRVKELLNDIQKTLPQKGQEIIKKWAELMEELFGIDTIAKKNFYQEYVPDDIQKWLNEVS